eukprot:TRINITY_DN8518_c0_g1_i2.p1 TRINITY_DN8518_c0_g1~~TRINITY_DN8518_c0_g1_i2.p1  ORF type:complete len:421 (-),score=96.08 TRINITY_DN8518_c0_g1_i2:208-1470(-)
MLECSPGVVQADKLEAGLNQLNQLVTDPLTKHEIRMLLESTDNNTDHVERVVVDYNAFLDGFTPEEPPADEDDDNTPLLDAVLQDHAPRSSGCVPRAPTELTSPRPLSIARTNGFSTPTKPPAAAPESSPATLGPIDSPFTRIQRVAQLLELTDEQACDLMELSGREIVVLADDSDAMNAPCAVEGVHGSTRWEQLQESLVALLNMLLCANPTKGFELRFLNSNGGSGTRIRNTAELETAWTWAKPKGNANLLGAFKRVLWKKAGEERKKSDKRKAACRGSWRRHVLEALTPRGAHSDEWILIVMTQGEPADGSIVQLGERFASKPEGVFVNVMLCTDEEEVVRAYEGGIDDIKNVDVLDDFRSEKRQVEEQGNTLSYNQYLIKCLLGAKLAKYDDLDGMPKSWQLETPRSTKACNCAIM